MEPGSESPPIDGGIRVSMILTLRSALRDAVRRYSYAGSFGTLSNGRGHTSSDGLGDDLPRQQAEQRPAPAGAAAEKGSRPLPGTRLRQYGFNNHHD